MSAIVMWRVRLDDGHEYGPVDEGRLLLWAREGRITPSTLISSDGESWIQAPRKPELGMVWLVEAPSGEYFGPFHHDVVQGLLDSKKITSESRTFRLSDGSEPALKSEIGKLKADYERVKSEKEDASKRAQGLLAELDRSRAEMAEVTRHAEGLAAELSRNRTDGKAKEEALAASSKREVALSAEIGQLKTTLRKVELELASSRKDTLAERFRADRTAAELKSAEERRLRETAELERVSAGKAAETARANGLAAELCRLNAALDYEKSQGAQLRSSLAVASKREATLAGNARDSDTALEQLKSVLGETQAKLKQAEARGVELDTKLKASEEKCIVLVAEVESEQDRSRKLGELLSTSACREATLADEAKSLKNAMDQALARIKELSDELESARAEVAKERKSCGELRVALEKAEKSGKKTGLGNLFQGKSLRDLSLLELAAQREFARRKRGRGPSGHGRPNADVIDV